MEELIRENEARLVAGFTPEEQERFSGFLLRAIQNMDGRACIRKLKEES